MSWHLNPSSAHRWVHCAANVQMAYKYRLPDEGGRSSADIGIHAHSVAHDILLDHDYDTSDPTMVEGGMLYAETIKSRVDVKHCIIEGYIHAPQIHKELGGVPDCWAFDKENNAIHIFDYKYGFTYVDAFENWQLISYAAAALANTNHDDDVLINMTIIQPRSFCKDGPVRTWSMYKHQLLPYFARLTEAAIATQQHEPQCGTGDHCYKCPAAHACITLQQSAYTACDISLNGDYELPDDLIGKEYSLLLEAQDRLKSRISGIETDLEYRLKTGRAVTGYMLEATEGRETWKVSDEEVIGMANILDIDVKKISVITPAQARKKGLNHELVALISERRSGGMKLVKARKFFA